MKTQTKRLSDVTKQATTDRTSKLVAGLMPSPPPVRPAEPIPEKTTQKEPDGATQETGMPDTGAAVPTPAAAPATKTERPKKAGTPTGFIGMIIQPLPDGLKCDKPIMLAGSQHQLLRELSFKHNKPMTEILYNLLEGATLPYQREQQKDV